MTRTDYYDYVNDFYIKYTKGMSKEEALLFNRWLTRICILSAHFSKSYGNPEEEDIKDWYNFNKEEINE